MQWIVSFLGYSNGVYGLIVYAFSTQALAESFAFNNSSLGTPTIAQVYNQPVAGMPYVPLPQTVAVGNWLLVIGYPDYLGNAQTAFYGPSSTASGGRDRDRAARLSGGTLAVQISATPS